MNLKDEVESILHGFKRREKMNVKQKKYDQNVECCQSCRHVLTEQRVLQRNKTTKRWVCFKCGEAYIIKIQND